MRLIALAAAVACATVALSGCGHHRPDAPPFAAISGANDAGIRMTVLSQKQRDRYLVLTVRIDNRSGQDLLLRNPESLHVRGFAISADGHEPQGADAGRYASTKSEAARLHDLPPGTMSEFTIKWTFDPPLAHELYPWSLTVGNMFIDGRRIGDVTLSWTPETR